MVEGENGRKHHRTKDNCRTQRNSCHLLSRQSYFVYFFHVATVYQVKAITGSVCSSYFSALAWLREVFSRRWGFGGHGCSLSSCGSAGTRYSGGGGGRDGGFVSPGPLRPTLALSPSRQCSTGGNSHCHNATAIPTTIQTTLDLGLSLMLSSSVKCAEIRKGRVHK